MEAKGVVRWQTRKLLVLTANGLVGVGRRHSGWRALATTWDGHVRPVPLIMLILIFFFFETNADLHLFQTLESPQLKESPAGEGEFLLLGDGIPVGPDTFSR